MERKALYHILYNFKQSNPLSFKETNDDNLMAIYMELKNYVNDTSLFDPIKEELHCGNFDITIDDIKADFNKIDEVENELYLYFQPYFASIEKEVVKLGYKGCYPYYIKDDLEETFVLFVNYQIENKLFLPAIKIIKDKQKRSDIKAIINDLLNNNSDIRSFNLLLDNFSLAKVEEMKQNNQDITTLLDTRYFEIVSGSMYGMKNLPKWYINKKIGIKNRRLKFMSIVFFPSLIVLAILNYFFFGANFFVLIAGAIGILVIVNLLSRVFIKED